jgi:hypothetical protein
MTNYKNDTGTKLRNGMIVRFVRQGKSYAQIARMPAVELSAGRIAAIISGHRDYKSIVADRDRARLRIVSDEAYETYQKAQAEKKRKLAKQIKKMTINQLETLEERQLAKIIKAVTEAKND